MIHRGSAAENPTDPLWIMKTPDSRSHPSVDGFASVVLEDEADDREQAADGADDEQPPAEDDAEEGGRREEGPGRGPPRVGAVEAELAGALRNLGVDPVLRADV